MKYCRIPIVLAYIAMIYIMTTLIYLLITRQYGTPFKDAVANYPNLMKIKLDSVIQRQHAFHIGMCISIIILCITRPFSICNN